MQTKLFFVLDLLIAVLKYLIPCIKNNIYTNVHVSLSV